MPRTISGVSASGITLTAGDDPVSVTATAGGELFSGFASGDTLQITGVANETINGFNNGTLSLGGTVPLSILFAGLAAPDFRVGNDPTVHLRAGHREHGGGATPDRAIELVPESSQIG